MQVVEDRLLGEHLGPGLHLHHFSLHQPRTNMLLLAGPVMIFLEVEPLYALGQRFPDPATLDVLVELHLLAGGRHRLYIP